MSRLPNELLVFILSLLRLKEAVATSILSRRWRYLWTFTPKLDFDGSDFFRKVRGSTLDLDDYPESLNYIRWVDYVLGLHNDGCDVEEFRVHFVLRVLHKEFIDRSLRYALARKVQRLELDFTNVLPSESDGYDKFYTFPYELLRNDLDSIDFKHLRRICMRYVNVSDEALEFFLCNCPLLEELSLTCSKELSTVMIIGPHLALKRLEIRNCFKLKSIEIRDTNLVFLKFYGKRVQHFVLKNVPLLVEMYVKVLFAHSVEDLLAMVLSHLPLLEKLTIEFFRKFSRQDAVMFASSSVEMLKLKQLWRFVLEAVGGLEKGLVFSTRCPRTVAGSYPHLKRVEFVGYRGVFHEHQIVRHLSESGVAVEEVIIDSRKRYSDWVFETNPHIQEDFNAVRARAREQLTKTLPSTVNLEIL